MDTVRVLDHYRTSVTRDHISFRILAHLFQSGPSSEAELASSGDISIMDVRDRLLTLYRANLVCTAPQSHWTTTELAALILARTGVVEASTIWFIDAFELPEIQREFLKQCVWAFDEVDLEAKLRKQSLVRSLWHIAGEFSASEIQHGDIGRALYSAIVGLDSRAQALGSRDYCDHVLAHWSAATDQKFIGRRNFYQKVVTALADARASTQLVLHGHSGVGKSGIGKSAFLLTWSRLLSASSTRLLDVTLRSCLASSTQERVSLIWNQLREWKSNLDEVSQRYFWLTYRPYHSLNDRTEESTDMLSLVVESLEAALRASQSIDILSLPEPRIQANLESRSEQLPWIRDALHRLVEVLGEGVFDQLDRAERKQICQDFDHAAAAFRARLLSDDTGGDTMADER